VSMWTLGAEVSCFGGGSSFAGVEGFSGAGEDARAGEVTGLVAGISGCAGDAGLSIRGLTLELEARSGASGALRKKRRS
jgi:hypothetical protein